MAVIKPFRALRPTKNFAAAVAAVPYDVVSRGEAANLAAESPHSFLRVTRAEIDLPESVAADAPEVYRKAKENLDKLIAENVLERDDAACLYVYRLIAGTHAQTAIVALCSLDEYDNDLIKKHEKTRADKEDDRTNHIIATRAQTGLIFLAYRGAQTINRFVSSATTAAPLYDFTAADGVQHTVWRVEQTNDLVAAFAAVPALYIADGHHRVASASRARAILNRQPEDCNHFVAAMFPHEELKILAYNRAVRDLNDLSETDFLKRLRESFTISDANVHVPEKRGEFCLYLGGKWRKLEFANELSQTSNAIENLDVSVLQKRILEPILNIVDVRTDKRIEFVGGARGTRELEKMVDSGAFAAAFSLFPTSIEDLLRVSDAGEIMPPKSTWFEPKLRDGLLIHVF